MDILKIIHYDNVSDSLRKNKKLSSNLRKKQIVIISTYFVIY